MDNSIIIPIGDSADRNCDVNPSTKWKRCSSWLIQVFSHFVNGAFFIVCKVIDSTASAVISLIPDEKRDTHTLIENYALTTYLLLDNERVNPRNQEGHEITKVQFYAWTMVHATWSKTGSILKKSHNPELLKRYMENVTNYFPHNAEKTQWRLTPQARFHTLIKKNHNSISQEEKTWCLNFGFSLIHIKEIGGYLPKYRAKLDEDIKIFGLNFLNRDQRAHFIPDYREPTTI